MKCKLWSVLVTGRAWPLWSAVSVEDKAHGAWRGWRGLTLPLVSRAKTRAREAHCWLGGETQTMKGSFWQHSVVGARVITNSIPT